MSKENRPNLHAVGLMIDIQNAVKSRIRGPAKELLDEAEILILTHNLFLGRIEALDSYLDAIVIEKQKKKKNAIRRQS